MIWFVTLPETNSKFTPENGWLEYDPFLLGSRPIFRGKLAVSFRDGVYHPAGECIRQFVGLTSCNCNLLAATLAGANLSFWGWQLTRFSIQKCQSTIYNVLFTWLWLCDPASRIVYNCLMLESGCVKSLYTTNTHTKLRITSIWFALFHPSPQKIDQLFTTNSLAQQILKAQVGPFFSGSLRLKASQSELQISKALFAVFAEGSCSPQMCLDQPSQGIFGVAYRQRNKVYPHDEDLSSVCVKKSSCLATWHSNVCFCFPCHEEFSFPQNGACKHKQDLSPKWCM